MKHLLLMGQPGGPGGPEDVYLYTEGVENVAWVTGGGYIPSGTTLTQTKESDHLLIGFAMTTVTLTAHMGWVTDSSIDLTPYTKLHIDWGYEVAPDTTAMKCCLIASTNKNYAYDSYDKRYYLSGSFSRVVSELDISTLSGDYFVRFHIYGKANDTTSTLRVYKVWLESE